jgi:tetratricopeptide (TPR) repeat protein
MISIDRAKRPAGFARKFALAIALATGTAMVGAVGFADTAQAQKKDRKSSSKTNYSKEFVGAYQALEATMKAEAPDAATAASQSAAVASVAVSDDERLAAGGMIMRAGAITENHNLLVQGVEMMLASGKLPAGEVGRMNFVGYQGASNLKQHDKARGFLQRAIEENFTTDTITRATLQNEMMQSYFGAGQYREGVGYLMDMIKRQQEEGGKVDDKVYRLGVGNAYTYEVVPELYRLTEMWIADYPNEFTWRESINIARNLNDFESPEILDLMRLGQKLGVLNTKQDYLLFIDAADARRLPNEVKRIIEQSYSTGVGTREDAWVSEQLQLANGRIAESRSTLASLEADASKANAELRVVLAAGNVHLSFSEYAKAASFFEKAAGMPGADRNEVLNRLGIAQVGMGDYSAAAATFGQITGKREPIARLWAAYAKQQQTGG